MNKYTITPENISDMFCHACAASVILEPLIAHNNKTVKAWSKLSGKYFEDNARLSVRCYSEGTRLESKTKELKDLYNTCEQLMHATGSLPEGNIEISLDHAIEIVYYSKQYENMGNKKLCFGVL